MNKSEERSESGDGEAGAESDKMGTWGARRVQRGKKRRERNEVERSAISPRDLYRAFNYYRYV